jgi:hypothetical protein
VPFKRKLTVESKSRSKRSRSPFPRIESEQRTPVREVADAMAESHNRMSQISGPTCRGRPRVAIELSWTDLAGKVGCADSKDGVK